MERLDFKASRRTIRAIVLTGVGIALVLVGAVLRMPVPVTVAFEMATTTAGVGQVFSATAAGYSELYSVEFPLNGDGTSHHYQVRLPGSEVPGGIRIDPGKSPGTIELRTVRFFLADVAADARLSTDVRLLSQLAGDGPGASGSLRLRSVGDDPSFEVLVPAQLKHWQRSRHRTGDVALAIGVLVLVALGWSSRRWLAATGRKALRLPCMPAIGAFVATLLVLDALGVGCDGWLCSPRGVRYGLALLVGALAVAAVGGALLVLLGQRRCRVRLFLGLGVGQAALMLYVFARSALHARVPALPLTTFELPLLAAAATAYLATRPELRSFVGAVRHRRWLLVELGILAAVCLVIADRELPRVLMLSSDPDLHAYLARQVELAGGIPWHGENVFHYPAGSAALTWAWSRLSLLDVRNALTALPLLQSYLAALILGESVAATLSGVRARTAVLFTALALTAAGFLVPVFASYSHMEGAGRQIAIAFMALLPVILCTERKQPIAAVALAATTLAALAALNPVNALVPCLLVALVAVHGLLRGERSGWLMLAFPLMLLCVLLDPYYQALLHGDAEPARITLSGRLHVKSVAEILTGWQWQLVHRLPDFVGGQMAMTPRNPAPLFAVFAMGLLVGVWMLRRRRRIAWPVLAVCAAAVAALFAADALFAAVADDRRFYLLSPYFRFSLLQHRILLLVALGALLMRTAATGGLSVRSQLALGAALVVVIGGAMRLVQPMSLEPRWSECGSLGCITGEDQMVMHAFADYAAKGEVPVGARVLVPNSLHHAAHEEWIFPVDGARALPFAAPVPVAFYYYQGDAAFTTDAYIAHVCRKFDRAWLQAQRVGYVFLPASRGSACMQGMEALPGAEHVLFHSGRAYLLELR